MLSEHEILEHLRAADIAITGPLLQHGDASSYMAFVKVARNQDNLQVPSNRLLHQVAKGLAERNTKIEFILKDESALDIEAGLRATLLHSHIDKLKNAFMSINKSDVHVWLEPKVDLVPEVIAEISDRAAKYFYNLDLTLASIHSTNDIDENLPSKVVLLRHLRQIAPATLGELHDRLEKTGFTIPSKDWLRRRLENLRSSNLLVWIKGGLYAVSFRGVHALGTTKNRRSPDIARLLAMARGHA